MSTYPEDHWSRVGPAPLLGVGAAERASQVRWGVLSDIVLAWLLTIPATAALSALLYLVVRNLV